MREQSSFASEAIEGLAFAAWLRTGSVDDDIRDLCRDGDGAEIETKGNPYHDPKDGRFTFAPGGAGGKRGYRGMTKHGSGIIEPVGGGGTDRDGKPRPELFAPDPYALKTPAEALAHYMGGSGEERNYYLQKVDMSGLSVNNFQEMRDLVAQGKPGVYTINDSPGSFNGNGLSFDHTLSSGAMIGGLNIHADGALVISKGGAYQFNGAVISDPDVYDFNPRTGRSRSAEFSTTVGRQVPGKPFTINMIGSKPITMRGHR